MASMKFIIENDVPKCAETEGNIVEIVSMVAYQIGSIHQLLSKQDGLVAKMFREMMRAVVGDPESPTWNMQDRDGVVGIAMCVPKRKAEEQTEEEME